MATTQNTPRGSRQPFNAPRFVTVVPITGSAELLATVLAAIGGLDKLFAFCKAFTLARFEATGWRSIKDISSRDTKHAAARPNEPATELLDVPFESMTATLAAIVEDRTKGQTKLTREQTLSAMKAVLDTEKEALEAAGIRLWDAYNENLQYSTLGMAALPSGQIPAGAREQAKAIKF
jgi:hypothetical protein